MTAATYSRYSSDNQRETSIEDQQRGQSFRAKSEGWPIVAQFADYETSAAIPMARREGGRAMLAAAMRGDFQVLLIEGLDRCWRDIVDQEQTLRRLEFAGIRIIGVSDGYDSAHEDRELQRGVRGVLNQQYLRDLSKKTHRGLTGQIIRGGFGGGLSYGYTTIEQGRVRALAIDEAQAAWVRWIFDRYAEGLSCQRIAAELNRQGVRTGRGGTWCVSALYGSPGKGSGILNNELYNGQYIWNRSRWIKDPDTGKRIRQVRPESEWMIEARPELRIVSDEQWQAVRTRMGGSRLETGGRGKGAQPRTLLGGLLKCGKCGGAVVAVSAREYGCAAHKDRGAAVCSGVRMGRQHTDTRLMATLREDLLAPDAVIELRQIVQQLLDEARQAAKRDDTRGQIADADREIARLVDAIARMGHSDALAGRLKEAEGKRAALQAKPKPVAVPAGKIDDVMARYKRQLANIEEALKSEPAKARPALASHFGKITIEEDTSGIWAAFATSPSALLIKALGDSGVGCGGAHPHPESRRIRLK